MEEIKKIIKKLKSYESKDFNPSDDAILECATRIFLQEKNNVHTNKPKPSFSAKKNSYTIKDPNGDATDAQKKKLDDLKIKYPQELTKGEAHGLIQETISKPSGSHEDY